MKYKQFLVRVVNKHYDLCYSYYDNGIWNNMMRANCGFIISDNEFITNDKCYSAIKKPWYVYLDKNIIDYNQNKKLPLVKCFLNSILLFEIMIVEISNGDLEKYTVLRRGDSQELAKNVY